MTELGLPLARGMNRSLTDGSGAKARVLNKQSNRGLVFQKFVDRWAIKDDKYDLHNAKRDWLQCFAGSANKAGDQQELSRACERVATIARRSLEAVPGAADSASEAPRNYAASARFATGLGLAHPVENGMLWHHTLGVPYLAGSSIKGLMRAWADHWGGVATQHWAAALTGSEIKDLVRRLFGNERQEDAQMGALIVFDALPVSPVELAVEVLTPHDGGWRLKGPGSEKSILAPSDWHSPVPVYYLVVEQGAVLQFALGATRLARREHVDRPSDVALGYQLLTEALEWVGIGAKTAVGLGRFAPQDVFERRNQEQAARKIALKEERRKMHEEREKARPPMAGDEARHPEWGLVRIVSIQGDMAVVDAFEEGKEATVRVDELVRK